MILLNRHQYRALSRSTPSPPSSALIGPLPHFGYYHCDLDAITVALDDTRYVDHGPNPD